MFWTVRNILLINYFAGDRLGSPVFSGQVKGSYSRFSLHRLELGHVVAGDVALELAGVGPREPPLPLGVVDDVQMFSLLEAEVLVSPRIVVIKRDENLVLINWVERS